MNILDWVLIIWLVGAFLLGARTGLVLKVGNLIGLVVSVYLAARYYPDVAPWLGGGVGAQLAAFSCILSVGFALSGIALSIIDKLFNLATIIPFLGSTNRLLGGVLGVLLHGLFLAAILYFAARLDINPVFTQTLQESPIAQILIFIGGVLAFLFPEAISSLERVA